MKIRKLLNMTSKICFLGQIKVTKKIYWIAPLDSKEILNLSFKNIIPINLPLRWDSFFFPVICSLDRSNNI